MEYIFGVFFGCLGVTLIAWIIVHCNGRILVSTIDLLTTNQWLSIATEKEIILLGLVPLAIASLVSTAGGNCHRSFSTLLITETIIFGLFIFNYLSSKNKHILFSRDFFKNNQIVFGLAFGWCFIFSIWSWTTLDTSNLAVERLILNGNADMWLYTRRFAAFTLDNLSFDNSPACDYLQVSPKKLSSFIGSILVDISPRTSWGITLFQGLLSCSLFLSLFGSWYKFNYNSKSLSSKGNILAIAWGMTSPTIFWLTISSYASNILFITIFVLGITTARHLSLHRLNYPLFAKFILLFSFILCIFSFYLVLLPVALLFYLGTLIVYQYEKYFLSRKNIKSLAKLFLVTGIIIIVCLIVFPHQISLNEVNNNLNLVKGHGKNFVPLNPWSLLQERLNPMPVVRDFGVWFNIIVGMFASILALKLIYSQLSKLTKENKQKTFYYKDLIGASLVILAYIAYLLAYIPLDYTYRLGKFAISIIYPLAILGLLPTIIWYRDRYYKFKSPAFKITCLVLIILHIILHISKMDLTAKPMGKYQIISTENINQINSLSIIKCQNSDLSQKYQKIVGLDLAKKYPRIKINVLSGDEAIANAPPADLTIRGQDAVREDDHNFCLFTIDKGAYNKLSKK